MGVSLRQIVYLSRAAAPWGDDQISSIGDVSKRNNNESDVTGLLLFDGQGFIQAVEGPAEAVDATMARIRADRRHHSIQVAIDREVPARQFGEWSMQCRRTPGGTCSVPFLRKIKDVVQGVDDTQLQAMFIGFALVGSLTQRRQRVDAG